MKRIKFFLPLIFFSFILSSSFAQDQTDALRLSQRYFHADARSAGAGNAFGAIGADFISTSINPAGLAFYRSSEFSWSLGFSNLNANGLYLDQSTDRRKYNFNIPDLDLVLTNLKKQNGQPVNDGWVSWTFAAGINRTNNYSGDLVFKGNNKSSSILYNYIETANGITHNNLSLNNVGGLAWDAYLIDSLSPTNYKPHFKDSNLNLSQTQTIKTRGSAYDINLSLAGNYSNKLYIGGTLSIPTLNYHETRTFNEVNLKTDTNYISSTYQRDLNISGYGFQALFGIIYKPIKYIRIGGSVQSPAFYKMSADYSQKMSSQINDGSHSAESEGNINFNLTTPFRATASLGIILDKYGFIGVDYEFVDYSLAYFNSDVYSYMDENDRVEKTYGATNNLRFGAEFKYKIFAIRGGYDIYGSPYTSETKPINADGSVRVISFGLGVREEAYFFDIAYQMFNTKEFILPYSLKSQNVDGAVETLDRNNLIFTFGLRF